jgi:hypothetical protein
LTGTGTSAQNLFFSDLKTTYDHIQNRGLVLRKERIEKIKQMKEQREARQKLYESFKQEDGTLKLPLQENPTEMELKQKEWFDALPEDYKSTLM